MRHRLVRRVAQLGAAIDLQLHQVGEGEKALGRLDVLRIGLQLLHDPALEVLRHVGAHLETHHAGKLPRREICRHHPEESPGRERLILLGVEVRPWVVLGAPRHAECETTDALRSREHRGQIQGDDLLERHHTIATGERYPARAVWRQP